MSHNKSEREREREREKLEQFERDIQDKVGDIMRERERRLIRGSVLILNSKSNTGILERERERERERNGKREQQKDWSE